MSKEITNNTKELNSQYSDRVTSLENQITIIELRQQELQLLISDINNNIQSLNTIINNKSSSTDAKKGARMALGKNIELLNQLYNTYKEFENTKFRYHQDINNVIHKKNHLINVDIPRVSKSSVDDVEFTKMLSQFVKLANDTNNNFNNPLIKESKEELSNNTDYEL
jgi:hypothetical protein